MKIAVVAHLARPGAVELVRRTVELLGSDEHEIALHVPEGVGSAPAPDDLAGLLERTTDLPDLVISFGGDGTFLRAARIARDADAPVIGVNVGRVGFLAEIGPRELDVVLPQLAAGHYEIESRSTLEVDLLDAAGRSVGSGWALNDVAVEKVARERLVRLDVSIGGTPFANVAADAVIVATSTGSTATVSSTPMSAYHSRSATSAARSVAMARA